MSQGATVREVPRVIPRVARCKKLEMQRRYATSLEKVDIVRFRDILSFQSLNRDP